jgi:hypothetical protein
MESDYCVIQREKYLRYKEEERKKQEMMEKSQHEALCLEKIRLAEQCKRITMLTIRAQKLVECDDYFNVDYNLYLFRQDIENSLNIVPIDKMHEIILLFVNNMTQKTHSFNINTISKMELKLMKKFPEKIKDILELVSLDRDLFDVSEEMDTSLDEEYALMISTQ